MYAIVDVNQLLALSSIGLSDLRQLLGYGILQLSSSIL